MWGGSVLGSMRDGGVLGVVRVVWGGLLTASTRSSGVQVCTIFFVHPQVSGLSIVKNHPELQLRGGFFANDKEPGVDPTPPKDLAKTELYPNRRNQDPYGYYNALDHGATAVGNNPQTVFNAFPPVALPNLSYEKARAYYYQSYSGEELNFEHLGPKTQQYGTMLHTALRDLLVQVVFENSGKISSRCRYLCFNENSHEVLFPDAADGHGGGGGGAGAGGTVSETTNTALLDGLRALANDARLDLANPKRLNILALLALLGSEYVGRSLAHCKGITMGQGIAKGAPSGTGSDWATMLPKVTTEKWRK